MGSFLSKLVTGNPFANQSLRDTLVNPSLMPGVQGAPQINLTGKGGQAQNMPDYSGILKAGTSQMPAQGPVGTSSIVAPQKFGSGLLGAARRRY